MRGFVSQVLVTIYWLGKAANSCASYSGTTLNLKEFEGLLAQMRKVTAFVLYPVRFRRGGKAARLPVFKILTVLGSGIEQATNVTHSRKWPPTSPMMS